MHGVIRHSMVVLGVLALGLVLALHAAAGPPGGAYTVTPLVSDIPGAAPLTDPELVNAWGLARSATSPWWVADNGPDRSSSRSTVYTSGGAKVLSVSVLGGPTGAVFAGVAGSFQIGTGADPSALAPAKFIFATSDERLCLVTVRKDRGFELDFLRSAEIDGPTPQPAPPAPAPARAPA